MLAEEIHDAISLTTGNMEATITMLNKMIIQLLTHYYSTHESIARQKFQQLCGFTKGTANRRLAELVKKVAET